MIPVSFITSFAASTIFGLLLFTGEWLHPAAKMGGFAAFAFLVAAVTMQRVRTGAEGSSSAEARSSNEAPKRTLIIGAGTVGQALAEGLQADDKYDVIGFLDDEKGLISDAVLPVLGDRDSAARIIREFGIEEVFVAYAPVWHHSLADIVREETPVTIRVVPSPFDSLLRSDRVDSVRDIAVVKMSAGSGNAAEALKRSMDVIVAATGSFLLAPLILVVAALIKLTSPGGPIIFSQERIGRFGKRFVVFKFRTMIPDAEAATGPILSEGESDSRLTACGRWLKAFRIDELPQLWNVIRGDMSLVGPRPERECFVRKFETISPTYSRRHLVRPGITGMAQVRGGYHTDWRDKLRFDLYYVAHQSLWLDVKILIGTVLVVLRPKSRR